MNVFITGIAGFIGYHTALKFKSLGHNVLGIDNFNDYYDVELKRDRAKILHKKDISVIPCDLLHEDNLNSILAINTPDLVIHLAAMAGVRYSMDNQQEYIDNNITGTLSLINSCERNDIDNVIYASTSCVMHGNLLPWNESDSLHRQINPYGYSKMVNESQFYMSKIKNAVGLRFFTVYGPWGRPDMALFDFTRKIIAGEPIELFNFGDMVRDFTYVDDIVQGITIVSENMTKRDVYNIGYGEQVQLEDFVKEIEKNLGIVAQKRYVPKHPADVAETWSDTTKLQKLGYRPTTSISDGVAKFLDWYKNYYYEEVHGG